jgi:hypothetical protein
MALLRRREAVLWRAVVDGVVVVTLASDDEVFLGGGAARVWELLEQPRSVDELASLIAGAPIADVTAVVERLIELDFIQAT